ncbi:sulfotransferase domain-containing protein [Salinibacter ruber]|uniref:sulfotransferase domain-containing protein n=1 Tax=Salinibacter ruber TaxID=146919 RepID=UPI003C6E4E47
MGEGSTTYSHAWLNRRERCAHRIRDYCPDARILYCVRHPLRQIESAWIMAMWALDNGHIQGTELHRSGKLDIRGDFNDDVRNNDGLVGTANYWQTLQCYRNEFSEDQIKIVFLEQLKANPDRTLAECCQFLGIAPDASFDDPDEARNTSASKGLATTFGRIVRSIPGYQALAAGAPSFLKTLVRPLIKDSFTEKPDWTPAVKETVISRLEEDTNRFLNYAGRPHDYWILDA